MLNTLEFADAYDAPPMRPAPARRGRPRGRKFTPPKFARECGLGFDVRFRGHVFYCRPETSEDYRLYKFYLIHHVPGPKPDGYHVRNKFFRPGGTTGGLEYFPTVEAAKEAVILTCRAIHHGVKVLDFPAVYPDHSESSRAERLRDSVIEHVLVMSAAPILALLKRVFGKRHPIPNSIKGASAGLGYYYVQRYLRQLLRSASTRQVIMAVEWLITRGYELPDLDVQP